MAATSLQDHDQIANSATGARIHELTSLGRVRALTALLLLQPQTPMLFQGQELAARSPFLYFADHEPELATAVRKGRREFLDQFPSLRGAELDPPDDEATFLKSKLDHTQRDDEVLAMHRELLALRREQHSTRAWKASCSRRIASRCAGSPSAQTNVC